MSKLSVVLLVLVVLLGWGMFAYPSLCNLPPRPLSVTEWQTVRHYAALCRIGDCHDHASYIAMQANRVQDSATPDENCYEVRAVFLDRIGISEMTLGKYVRSDKIRRGKELLEEIEEVNSQRVQALMNIVNDCDVDVSLKDLGAADLNLDRLYNLSNEEPLRLLFARWRITRNPEYARDLVSSVRNYNFAWRQIGAWDSDVRLIKADADRLKQ